MPNPDWLVLIFVVFVLKWVREKKNEGREKDVFKTYLIATFIRRSNWDVFPCFQIEPNMNVLLWTSFVRTFLVRVSTGFCLLFTDIHFSQALSQDFVFYIKEKDLEFVYDHQTYFRCSLHAYIYIYSYLHRRSGL